MLLRTLTLLATTTSTTLAVPAHECPEGDKCRFLPCYLPDTEDCAVFYECDPRTNQPRRLECPPGLYFDIVLNLCTFPDAAHVEPGCESKD